MDVFLPIATERLVLRRFELVDAPVLSAYRCDPEIARYQSWDVPYPVERAQDLIAGQAHLDGPTPGEWIQIAVTRNEELVGDVAVGLSATGQVATLGYTLAPAHHGNGFATEAVSAVVDRLFDDLDIHRAQATVDPRNLASARVVEALGFEYEGTARSAELVRGEWTDDARYGLTRDGWVAWRERPRGAPADVRLVEITPSIARSVFRLTTHRSQERFVAPMPASFADALIPEHVDGAPVVPWFRAIEADGELAGFVMLAERTAAHPEAYLWRLLIDRRHQRRGIGDRVLAQLVEQLRADGHETLLVSWYPGAGGPEPFYLQRGFVPTGKIEDGEIEARLRL